MAFIESSVFERYLPRYLSDEQFGRLQLALRNNPTRGALIPGSGGVRKLRWGRGNLGRRGGVRVIYCVKRPHEIWLLKKKGSNRFFLHRSSISIDLNGRKIGSTPFLIPAHLLRAIKREMDNGPTKN